MRALNDSRYDRRAPWWFRNTLWMYLVFGPVVAFASGYRNVPLLIACGVVLAFAGVGFVTWDRRHRVRR